MKKLLLRYKVTGRKNNFPVTRVFVRLGNALRAAKTLEASEVRDTHTNEILGGNSEFVQSYLKEKENAKDRKN